MRGHAHMQWHEMMPQGAAQAAAQQLQHFLYIIFG